MSCTIFYKGTLKENYNPSDVLNIVSQHVRNINAEIMQSDNPIIINFLQGKSESLVFDFKDKKVDSFCKWNGENPEEFYRIFDMFIALQPLFKSLKIEDDEGLWNEYISQKKPCKIRLRPLFLDEIKFLERIKINEMNPPTEIEKFVMTKSTLTPFYKSLLRVIVQDFIKIMNFDSIDDFNPQSIVDLANELRFMGKYYYKHNLEHFNFEFPSMLLEIWIGNTFEYKKMGLVKELSGNIRGFATSTLAAFEGIKSIFLNRHAGGASNAKEAEMIKLAKKYYKTGALGEVMVIDKPEKELEMLFSMMDYLGFGYVGVD